jgi:hypothetical protein
MGVYHGGGFLGRVYLTLSIETYPLPGVKQSLIPWARGFFTDLLNISGGSNEDF